MTSSRYTQTSGSPARLADVGRAGARRPLRIAFIGARGIGASYSGIETYYEEVGSRLASFGHEVLAYCRPHFTPANVDGRGVTPIFRPCIRTKHGETFTHTVSSTVDVLSRPMDVVQFHALGPSLFAGFPRLRGTPTIASIRGLDWQREKWGRFAKTFLRSCESMSHRLASAVAVVSQTLQRYYRDRHGRDVEWIPNGVTLTPDPPPSEIFSLGLEPGRFFLFMGRLSPEKGCDVLLEAFRGVPGQMKLVMAGGSSYTDDYGEQLRASAPPGVLFPGSVGGRLRAELLAHAAAFVLPSTIEGMSISLLEAMGQGRCVVTSDIEENREVVDGVGWMAPPRDAAALADALRRVVDFPERAAELGRLARSRVESQYTWDRVARKTEDFFYRVVSARQRSRNGGGLSA